MINIINNKNKGVLFWITGLSGSGKTTIAKKIKPYIEKKYGPTIIINGDDMRTILKLNKYDKKSRLENGRKFSKLCKLITNQNINVIFSVVGLFHTLHSWNRKNIENYCEIFLKTSIKKIIQKNKKKIYHRYQKNIVGLDIKPEFPKNPEILINNSFKEEVDKISKKITKYL